MGLIVKVVLLSILIRWLYRYYWYLRHDTFSYFFRMVKKMQQRYEEYQGIPTYEDIMYFPAGDKDVCITGWWNKLFIEWFDTKYFYKVTIHNFTPTLYNIQFLREEPNVDTYVVNDMVKKYSKIQDYLKVLNEDTLKEMFKVVLKFRKGLIANNYQFTSDNY